ncbi:MAG: hypothetical protein KTR30_34925 [Saprospiraceae bacterium]|nr:hypothetical protein [Saprospiraceae bacterium]
MKQQSKIFLGLVLVTLQLSFSKPKESWREHALYLGTLQLKYIEQSAEAHLAVKVFSDDLQSAIRNADESFQVGPIDELFNQNGPLIEAYFEQHLQLEINGISQVPKLYQSEQINDTHILKFKIACPPAWNHLELTADFFMELFPNQMNVVSVSYLEQKQFARLNKQQPQCEASFSK